MNQSAEIGEVAQAIASAMGKVGRVAMTGVNKELGYRYASDDDLMRAVQPAMSAAGLTIVPTGMRSTLTEVGQTRSGARTFRCDLTVYYRIVHSSGQWIGAVGFGQGIDYGDKATYKAQTGAYKYLLRATFCIPCGEDAEGADVDASNDRAQAAARAKPVAPRGNAPNPVEPSRAAPPSADVNPHYPELTDDELHDLTDSQLAAVLKAAKDNGADPKYVAAVAARLNARIKRAKGEAA